MDIDSMISVLRLTQRLIERNSDIDHSRKGYRKFNLGIESLGDELEALRAKNALAPAPPVPPWETAR
jgi:hypothetical protein